MDTCMSNYAPSTADDLFPTTNERYLQTSVMPSAPPRVGADMDTTNSTYGLKSARTRTHTHARARAAIGWKLLQNSAGSKGYCGGGLGAKEQGMTAPIQACARPILPRACIIDLGRTQRTHTRAQTNARIRARAYEQRARAPTHA